MGDFSFQNNVPNPLLAGKELPTFKFEVRAFPRKDVFIAPSE